MPGSTARNAACECATQRSRYLRLIAQNLIMEEEDDVRYFGTYEPLLPYADVAEVAATGRPVGSPIPAAEEARRQGYVPLREITGVGDLRGPLWPPQLREWSDDLGAVTGEYDDDEDRWLVQSPWPAISVPQVLTVLWRWVERDPYPQDREQWTARIREVLSWDEVAVRRLLDAE